MSDRLAISAAFSILLMAGMVLFNTSPAEQRLGGGATGTAFEATTLAPNLATPLFGTSR